MFARARHATLTAAILVTTTSCVSNPASETIAAARPAAVVAPVQAVLPPPPAPDLLARLGVAAPKLDRQVLELALQARQCAIAHGDIASDEALAVIDYSLPSTQKRMWVFDVDRGKLLFFEYVAHGQNSGGNMTTSFSNAEGSHQSSFGLFRTAGTYVGGNGYSMRMDGLEPGINDNARERLIVMHGAPYVNPVQARKQGRLGRSWGCPALRQAVARDVIDVLKGGQLLFAYYPQDNWLANSRYFNCDAVADASTQVASSATSTATSTSGARVAASLNASLHATAGIHAAAH